MSEEANELENQSEFVHGLRRKCIVRYTVATILGAFISIGLIAWAYQKFTAGSFEILWLTITYFIVASAVTYDKRLVQWAKVSGESTPQMPSWIGWLYWLETGLLFAIVLIKWKYAICLYIALFILAVFPVLETVGRFLIGPLIQQNIRKIDH